MNKKIFPLLFLPIALSQIVLVNVEQIPKIIYENTNFTLILNLQNAYNQTKYDVELNINASSPCLKLSNTSFSIDRWGIGKTIQIPLFVENHCKFGNYWIKISNEENSIVYFLTIYPLNNVIVKIIPKSLVPNKYNKIELEINSKYLMRNAYLYLQSNCLLNQTFPIYLGDFKEKVINIYINPLTNNVCKLNATLRYYLFNNFQTSSFYFELKTNLPLATLEINKNSYSLSPGEEKEIKLKLIAKGCGIKNIITKVNSANLPLTVDNPTQFVYSIPQFSTYTLTFDVKALEDAKTGLYKLPIEFDYQDCLDKEHKETIYVPIKIIKKLPIISYAELEKDSLTITVSNPNNEKIYGVYVNLIPLKGIKVESPNKYFIGEIDSNDYETAYFNYKLGNSTEIKFKYEVFYRDSLGNWYNKTYTFEKKIEMQIQTKENRNYLPLIVGIFVIVLLAFIWRKRKR